MRCLVVSSFFFFTFMMCVSFCAMLKISTNPAGFFLFFYSNQQKAVFSFFLKKRKKKALFRPESYFQLHNIFGDHQCDTVCFQSSSDSSSTIQVRITVDVKNGLLTTTAFDLLATINPQNSSFVSKSSSLSMSRTAGQQLLRSFSGTSGLAPAKSRRPDDAKHNDRAINVNPCEHTVHRSLLRDSIAPAFNQLKADSVLTAEIRRSAGTWCLFFFSWFWNRSPFAGRAFAVVDRSWGNVLGLVFEIFATQLELWNVILARPVGVRHWKTLHCKGGPGVRERLCDSDPVWTHFK